MKWILIRELQFPTTTVFLMEVYKTETDKSPLYTVTLGSASEVVEAAARVGTKIVRIEHIVFHQDGKIERHPIRDF